MVKKNALAYFVVRNIEHSETLDISSGGLIMLELWPMGGKAKSRCGLGMLKVSKLRQRYLNLMKLEDYGTTGQCLNDNH
jgi:hypothetical protein